MFGCARQGMKIYNVSIGLANASTVTILNELDSGSDTIRSSGVTEIRIKND